MKLKTVFISLLILSSSQFAVASDLDDAINFVNGKLADCRYWFAASKNGSTISKNMNQKIINYIYYMKGDIKRRLQSGSLDNSYEYEIPISKLDSKIETKLFYWQDDPSERDGPQYIIKVSCFGGGQCIKNTSGARTEMVGSNSLYFCSESDMNRAAKALEDAIRLSGGKTSKY